MNGTFEDGTFEDGCYLGSKKHIPPLFLKCSVHKWSSSNVPSLNVRPQIAILKRLIPKCSSSNVATPNYSKQAGFAGDRTYKNGVVFLERALPIHWTIDPLLACDLLSVHVPYLSRLAAPLLYVDQDTVFSLIVAPVLLFFNPSGRGYFN